MQIYMYCVIWSSKLATGNLRNHSHQMLLRWGKRLKRLTLSYVKFQEKVKVADSESWKEMKLTRSDVQSLEN